MTMGDVLQPPAGPLSATSLRRPEMGSEVGSRGRILLVDDEAAILRAYSKLIEATGHHVDTASSGHEAVQRILTGSYDVIVSDVVMPNMTGVEFMRAVRGHDLDVPVILMTGAPEVDSAVTAVEFGAFRYLVKPFKREVLEETIGQAMRFHALAKLKRHALELVGGEGRWLGDLASVETRFARALKSIWTAFQPIVSWKAKSVVGYEALVRTDELTIGGPADLFRAADRLGKVHELSRAIRDHVAAAASSAPLGTLMFVNVHPQDFEDVELYSPGAPLSLLGDRVVLEITERVPLDSVFGLESRVASLKHLGLRIALDDLGAGYAGLRNLTQLSPDFVKIDTTLVRDVDRESKKQQVVGSMVRLSRELGMKVIMEGVETQAERETLLGLEADLMQGYLFGRPSRGFELPIRW
jgi:EAL domain-containing protein (putative c-di-GMP-specific phosphodiesterase class I)